jgi:hypothetical protein
MPSPLRGTRSSGLERTPEGFVFDVKAFRLLTGYWTPPEGFLQDLRDQLGPITPPGQARCGPGARP